MQSLVHGIVLRVVRYSDTRQIVDLYTREHGRLSVVVSVAGSGSRGRRGGSAALWRPLNLVEMLLDVRPGRLSWPREPRLYCPYVSLPFHPVKSAVGLFLSELLAGALRAETSEALVYDFVETSLRWYDGATSTPHGRGDDPLHSSALANFHIVFMLRLMRFVGIWPDMAGYKPGWGFDLLGAEWCAQMPPHGWWLTAEESCWLPLLGRMTYRNMHLFHFTRVGRRRIISVLNEYYRLHLQPFPALRSLDVLVEVFDGGR